ncbi:MAG: ABC transporter ATP-binding protein [Burkholderiaceae bacterium]|nr:ABC transporter ATP-binding protein [Burkholderiaceae bacterium]MEB2351187.1 ABC transporter ATP-binding protein [Burkholderiaceae bacterium]
MLRVADVNLAYGGRRALNGVSLEIGAGEIVSLIGSNGAGKSSTLKAIMGLQPIESGEIWFEGERIDRRDTPEIVARGIALSPEGRRVFPRMSVLENLLLGAYTRKDAGGRQRTLDEIFDHFPRLAERRGQNAGLLSGGEQQMLAIGRALMAKPKLLMLDEPSLGLAPLLVREIGQIVRSINAERGISIILVEQNASLALKVCGQAYVMESGRITLSGGGAELGSNEYVRRAYLGA